MIQTKYTSLGREEKIILSLLTQYGPLKVSQIEKYLSPYIPSAEKVGRIIERMIYRRLIHRCGGLDYDDAHEITVDPAQKLTYVDNSDRQRAFWVIIDFIVKGRISGRDHSAAEYPSQAMLINGQTSIFEIITVTPGNEKVTSYQVRNHHETRFPEDTPDDDAVKYIVVIENPGQIQGINIPNLYAFALVNNESGDVRFIAPKRR